MQFIHCADIHLDSPLRGLGRYQDAPVQALRSASRRAFENVVALALSESVAFVVIAGDLYDGDWQDFNTGLFFVQQMGRLRRAGIGVYLVRGNHDADSKLTRSLPLPDNVHVFSSRKPETILDDRLMLAVHGQSFAEAAVTADLAAGYPAAVPGRLNVGVLHTAVNGREGHADYAPCSLDTLVSKGYEYWALGHVHHREILHQSPWVVFPGNVQGRHVRETGSKGCQLVTVDGQEVVRVEHRAMDVVRWHLVTVDAGGCTSRSDVLDRVQDALRQAVRASDGRPAAVRIRLTGRSQAHAELAGRPEQLKEDVRALSLSCDEGDVWIEKVQLDTQRFVDSPSWLERDDALADLRRMVSNIEEQPSLAFELMTTWQELLRKLPPELTEAGGETWSSGPALKPMLRQAEETLLARLYARDEGGGR